MSHLCAAAVATLAAGIAAISLVSRTDAHTRITTDVTWSEHIRPIFIQRCMPCHHPGGLAPDYVDLTIYGTDTKPAARAWAAQIEDEISLNRMPPWNADSRFANYANSRALSEEERNLIIAWIRGGAPQGPYRNLPIPDEFLSNEWKLGQPDLVIGLPQGHVMPANKSMDTASATVPVDIDKDTYITGYEFLVGNPENVAKVSAWIRDPAGFEPAPIEVEVSGEYDPFASDLEKEKTRFRQMPGGPYFLGQWVKGDGPVLFPDAAGRLLRVGSTIELRVEYVRPEFAESKDEIRDNTQLGLFLAGPNEEIDLLVESREVASDKFVVPAGKTIERSIETKFEENFHLLAIEPHMGPVATRMKAEIFYPDGLERTLVWVPKYAHRWATGYRFAEPVAAPVGTRLVLTAYFDNTRHNEGNPNDPPVDIKTGPGFLDERFYSYVHHVLDDHLKLQPVFVAKESPQGAGMLGGAAGGGLFPNPLTEPTNTLEETTKAAEAALQEPDEPERIRIASNGYHQVQGTMPRRGEFRLRVFDDKMEPIDPRNFTGELTLADGSAVVPLVHFAPDDAFLSAYPNSPFPVEFQADITLGNSEETLPFRFDGPTLPREQTDAEPTNNSFVQPPHGGWLESIGRTPYRVEAVLPEAGELRFYFYGPEMQPVDPRNFHGSVKALASNDTARSRPAVKLIAPARAEYLHAEIPADLPLIVELELAVARGNETLRFEFDELSEAPWDPAADAMPSPRVIVGPHGSPEFYSSANGFNFVEAALPRPGEFRVYFYDAWKNIVDPGIFDGEIRSSGVKAGLERARPTDEFLTAYIGSELPVVVDAALWFGGKEESFAFKFDGVTIDPATRVNNAPAHMDHTPLHGGEFFMADNMFHHVEGTLPAPGDFRLYFYDDFKRPIDPRNFSGTARIEHLEEKSGEVTEEVFELSLRRPGDEFLSAVVPASMPCTLYALVKLGGVDKRFDFQFDKLTIDTGGPMTGMAMSAAATGTAPIAGQHLHIRPPLTIPKTVPDILAAIDIREANLKQLIASQNWLTLYQPAFDIKDLVSALAGSDMGLDVRQRGQIKLAIGSVNLAANKLDRAGDTQDAPRVQAVFDELAAELARVRLLFQPKK